MISRFSRSGLVPFHDAGYFGLAHAVDSAYHPADFRGDTLGRFFGVEIELHFQIHIGAGHILMIRRQSYDRM
jgi:hypothetical protein